MPIYEYVCNRCARTDEKIYLNRHEAPTVLACPETFCGGIQHKVISKGSFVMLDEFGDSVSLGKP